MSREPNSLLKLAEYDLSLWATTIRYNSNFKTNRNNIELFNEKAIIWINSLKDGF